MTSDDVLSHDDAGHGRSTQDVIAENVETYLPDDETVYEVKYGLKTWLLLVVVILLVSVTMLLWAGILSVKLNIEKGDKYSDGTIIITAVFFCIAIMYALFALFKMLSPALIVSRGGIKVKRGLFMTGTSLLWSQIL